MRTVERLFIWIEIFEGLLPSRGEDRTCLGYRAGLMKAISSFSLDSSLLAAAWPSWVAGTEMKKILRLVVLVTLEGWRGAVSGKSRYLDNLQATRTT